MPTLTTIVTAAPQRTRTTSFAGLTPILSPVAAKMKDAFLRLAIPSMPIPMLSGLVDDHYDNNSSSDESNFDEQPELVTWFLDTRTLWPGDNIFSASGAADALALISAQEQHIVTTKMFIADARMSLGSALLKRLFISKTLGIPWKDVRMARKGDPKHGKPCAVDEMGKPIQGIDFNVSHQNGLVALIGWNGRGAQRHQMSGGFQGMFSPRVSKLDDVMVGVDIVCVNERESAASTIDSEGFDGWVDIYDAVFSDEERWTMKYDVDYLTLLDGTVIPGHDIGRHDRCIMRNKDIALTTQAGQDLTFNSELLIDAKLRRFYTYFCYKESYIKLAGEALLAPWLKDLEFFNVRSPQPGTVARCSTLGTWGEEVDDVEVRMHGRVVSDVKMKIQAFEEDFMLSTSIQGNVQGRKIPGFTKMSLEKDILTFANSHLHDFDSGSSSPIDLMSPWESRYWS